jgi:hypothetical protein
MIKTTTALLFAVLLAGPAHAQLKPVEKPPQAPAVENAKAAAPGTNLGTRPVTAEKKPARGTPSTTTQAPAAPPATPTQKGTGKTGDK